MRHSAGARITSYDRLNSDMKCILKVLDNGESYCQLVNLIFLLVMSSPKSIYAFFSLCFSLLRIVMCFDM